MKLKWIVPLVAVTGLLVAMAAFAADAARKAAAPEGQQKVVHVEVNGDDEAGDLVWEDEDGLFALAGDEPGEGDDQRIVIRHRTGPMGRWGMAGMGRGMGRGMGHGMGPGMGHGMGMGRAFALLDLTDEQRTKLADLHESQARRDIQARADLEIARMDMRKLLEADKPSTTAINTQVDKIAKMGAEMKKSRIGTLLEARALLTPEQQKKLKEARVHGPGGMKMHEGAPGDMKSD